MMRRVMGLQNSCSALIGVHEMQQLLCGGLNDTIHIHVHMHTHTHARCTYKHQLCSFFQVNDILKILEHVHVHVHVAVECFINSAPLHKSSARMFNIIGGSKFIMIVYCYMYTCE